MVKIQVVFQVVTPYSHDLI